jgi:hypothetical protein
MKAKTKKATFNLSTEVIEALDEAMSRGAAPSKNALVQDAIIKELKELKKQDNQDKWQRASKDPLFVRDIERLEADFRHVDADPGGGK